MNSNIKKHGIINFSNNCYLNVIIQLYLCDYNTSNIIIEYLDIINYYKNDILNPEKLLKKLSKKIDINKQNDSQEIFTLILDLIPELEKYYKNKINNFYTCQQCNIYRIKEDTFSTFYIHKNSLEDSIKEIIKPEIFELECENCNKKTITKKTCKIKKLGNILIFFNILKNNLKITENIVFGKSEYKLTGIIKHYGNEKCGHYIFIDYINKLIIDDIKITKLENFNMDNIYLVFYNLNNKNFDMDNTSVYNGEENYK